MNLALAASGIDKSFAGTPALQCADLRVRQGTVHALLGGNGSGKSTLIKLLAGVHTAERGEISVGNTTGPAADMTAHRARELGLRFVHQDLGLFDSLTIAENIALGDTFPTTAGGIRWRTLHRRVAELLARFEIAATPTTMVGALRPAQRTMVAVARALQGSENEGAVLLLDEPTASLPDHEARLLMRSLRRRADAGQTIVLVSHHMAEVLSVADDITVLRDGQVVGAIVGRTPTEDELVELIAGRAVDRRRVAGSATDEPVLEITGLEIGPLRGLDVTLHRGEIVGLAGLVGSGRSTLLTTLFGTRGPAGGTTTLHGKRYSPGSPRAAMAQGVALIPEDRLADAAFLDMTVAHNASATFTGRYWRGWMRLGRERSDTNGLIRDYAVKTVGPDALLASLSGGNQQKVMLARWLRRDPSLLLLDEPTQGVDVVSRNDIYRSVRAAAAGGCAVLVASSDFEELALLCDRVLVLRGGRVAANLLTTSLTADRLTHLVQTDQPPTEVRL